MIKNNGGIIMSRKSKRYTEEFKKQLVMLVNSGKSSTDIINEYRVSRSALYKWVNDYNNTNSFKAKDNRTDEENEMIKLKKRLAQLEMENDILKQAALIMGRK